MVYLMVPASVASASCQDSHAQCLGIEVGLAPLSLSCCLLSHLLHSFPGVLDQDADLTVVTTSAFTGNSELSACDTLGHQAKEISQSPSGSTKARWISN